ncbi:hypothetical protein HanPSC8_Chr15g0653331 [Helianthus annuus]|nr:hypothetical protein HanPSC8_Chr15g0653331 [Helianthus annuus]
MASQWYKHLATEYDGRYTHLYEQLKARMREGLGQPPQPLFQHIFEHLKCCPTKSSMVSTSTSPYEPISLCLRLYIFQSYDLCE